METGLQPVTREPRRIPSPVIAAAFFGIGVIVGLTVAPNPAGDRQLTDPLRAPALIASQAPTATGTPSSTPRSARALTSDTGLITAGHNDWFVDGTRLSFEAPFGWESFGRDYPNHITKSVIGPQGAEAVLFWTALGFSSRTAVCEQVLPRGYGVSAASLVNMAASARGLNVVAGPTETTVGGRGATHVTLRVRADLGCDPGYLFLWPWVMGGALWIQTLEGDTIELWAIDMDEGVFVIESIVRPDGGPRLVQEIHQIVDSIRFD